jgi:hypothetical protein
MVTSSARQWRKWLPFLWIALSAACPAIDYSFGPIIQFPIVYLVPVTLAESAVNAAIRIAALASFA